MLTFILLVVLAGGVGLIAVSAAEHDDPARKKASSRRRGTSWFERVSVSTAEPAKRSPTAVMPSESTDEPMTLTGLSGDENLTTSMAPPTPHRTTRGNVPAKFTAVEGAFELVAYRSLPHRAFSTIRIVLLVVVVAVVIAGTTGVAIAVIARALDSAIG